MLTLTVMSFHVLVRGFHDAEAYGKMPRCITQNHSVVSSLTGAPQYQLVGTADRHSMLPLAMEMCFELTCGNQ